jgi:hypothetical protein
MNEDRVESYRWAVMLIVILSVLIKDWGMEPFLSFWMHVYHLAGQIRWTDREAE